MGMNQFKFVCAETAKVMVPPGVGFPAEAAVVLLLLVALLLAVWLELLVPQPLTAKTTPVDRAMVAVTIRRWRFFTANFAWMLDGMVFCV